MQKDKNLKFCIHAVYLIWQQTFYYQISLSFIIMMAQDCNFTQLQAYGVPQSFQVLLTFTIMAIDKQEIYFLLYLQYSEVSGQHALSQLNNKQNMKQYRCFLLCFQ
ncbi:transmembrane protein, putative (macronuclear) [Tetrahymena thermophila SB210]|uniref:Transmembrane protein, putative n=1 Tax=Tetrahymena thermophila (strain SB210) TaxID=312017 RepID=W7X6X5_TETTS|nr:transmembrane protein, putative [Tetrahymena thermophila SB210]EWS72138.1 transmembrane protein, putative [Tetrahymena thermophila SB210]|eukprot:XP_012655331.1 transmembrane protein, putative [Tetrahymena thermophila SB210]